MARPMRSVLCDHDFQVFARDHHRAVAGCIQTLNQIDDVARDGKPFGFRPLAAASQQRVDIVGGRDVAPALATAPGASRSTNRRPLDRSRRSARRREAMTETAMLIEHRGKRPHIDPAAVIAPTAVICGDVTVGPRTHVSFGAVLVAQGGPIRVGTQCVIRENVVIRSTVQHPVEIGDYVLIGPRSALNGCRVDDEVFLATGVTIFHGARIGRRAEVRINGVVHVRSVVAPRDTVPIGWVAVGDPARILPPERHEEIWSVQKPLNFPQVVYGVERAADGGVDMREVTRRVIAGLAEHGDDRVL
jgi:carbonic anhydrase/acetyltransferase-like protein (isoleucine patch superfamily)